MPFDATHYQPGAPPMASAPPHPDGSAYIAPAPWVDTSARRKAFMRALATSPVGTAASPISRAAQPLPPPTDYTPPPTLKEIFDARRDARDADGDDYTPTADDWAELRDYLRGIV